MFRTSLALLALALAGCGGGGGGGAPPPPPPAKASLTVVNSTALHVTEVYVTAASSGSWGANQLSSSIPPGASRTISNIAPGRYDVRAVASDGSYLERYQVQLTEGGAFTWTLVSSTGSLRITNNYTSPITEVYVSSSSSANWGPNQLTAPIPVGGVLTLTNIAPGLHDLRAVAADGAWIEEYGVSFAAGAVVTWTLSPAAPTTGSVTVVNNYAYPITQLYIAPSTSSTWGPNQLSSPIPVGGSISITDIPPGLIDLYAVASDGSFVERYDVPLAAGAVFTWTLTTMTPTGSVVVVNNYSFPITELYITPSTSSTWGPNQLDTPIPVGGSIAFSGVPAGLIDLRAVASDGAFTERYDAFLDAGGTFTWTLTTTTATLTVVNSTGYTIYELYVAPASSPSWGPNLLTTSIPPGGSFTLTDIPPAIYHFQARTAGWYWERLGQALAAGTTFTWTLLP